VILHIGLDHFVSLGSIEMILDYKNIKNDQSTKSFFEAQKKVSELCRVGQGKCKSVVITSADGVQTMYFSPISGFTLLKRSREFI
jgi:hypothetical protein